MKKFLPFLLLALLATTARAQVPFAFGVKAGVNANQLVTSGEDLNDGDLRLGLMGGVFARVGSSFYVQPEVIFGQKGGNLQARGSFGNRGNITRRINTLDVPVMVGKSFGVPLAPVKLRLNAGPVLSLPVWAEQDGRDYRDALKSATLGYQAGVGLDAFSFTLDLRYEGGFGKLGSGSYTVDGYTFRTDDRVSLFQLALGYKLTQ